MRNPERKERLNLEQLVIDISEYEGRSGRLRGIRELKAIGARTPDPFFVATHEAFVEYKKYGLTESLKQAILSAFREIRQKNPHRGAFVGWRTVTPEGVPPGPRTSAIYDENEFLAYTEYAWRWARKQGYDQESNEIVLAFHPFIHAAQESIPEDYFLWPGGDATVLKDGRVKLRAGFGPDEISQSCPCDAYLVNLGRFRTEIRKTIAQKTETLLPEPGYPLTEVPSDYQKLPALRKDSQILEIAEVVKNLQKKYGFRRVEFILQEEGVVFRECAPYDPEPAHFFFLKNPLQQPAVVINSEKDIERINPPEAIAYLPRHLFIERKVPDLSLLLVDHVKEENIKLAVLPWGEIETQHMARNFRDAEITVLFIKDKTVEDGQIVRVYEEEDGTPAWEIIGEKKKKIIELTDPESKQRETVGDKAASLAILREHGIRVPPGFCPSTTALAEHLQSLGLNGAIGKLNSLEGKVLEEQIEEIREKIIKIPLSQSLAKEIQDKLAQFPETRFSARSSSPQEDLAAGQFHTSLNVPPQEIPLKVKECLASLFSLAPLKKAKREGILPSEMKMSVLIHPMIEGRGGVIYTNPSEIVISAAESAEIITSGRELAYHKIILDRNLEIVRETIPSGGQIVTEEEARKVAKLALKIENIFDCSQDIEWVIDKEEGKIWTLQARPLA